MGADQIQQPFKALVKGPRIERVQEEFIQLRNERFDIFQLIQRIRILPGRLPVEGTVALVDLLYGGFL